jgi:dTDP-4-amino-4,6-dideoxygalactose transaminase
VVSVSSATLGITGAVTVCEATAWVAPAWTFPATGLAVIEGAQRLRFSDINETSWLIEPGPATPGLGLLPVVPFGGPLDVSLWPEWPEVVLDAAASLGTQPNLSDLPAGWTVVFSLHATKVLGCGEGGIVVFGDVDRARRFRAWTNFGFMGSRVSETTGTNAKLSEMGAAYGLAALDAWPDEHADWVASHELAADVSSRLDLTGGPTRLDGTSPYWIVEFASETACLDAERRLHENGVQTRRWWPELLPGMPAFRCEEASLTAFPVAHALSRRVLGLPMYRRMGHEVADAVLAALGQP